jgi:rhodanese-related sulfurtransferase
MSRGNVALSPTAFENLAKQEQALILDTRSAAAFTTAHIPGSVFIGLDGSFAPWVGALITDLNQAIVFVADAGREEEVITRLSRVGYDNTLGYLDGGMEAWVAEGKPVEQIRSIPAALFEEEVKAGKGEVLDVRKPGEYEAEHLKQAISYPLDFINENKEQLDKEKTYYVHCAGGYRSVIAASLMKARGFDKLIDVKGGFKAIRETGLAKTAFVCPTTVTS